MEIQARLCSPSDVDLLLRLDPMHDITWKSLLTGGKKGSIMTAQLYSNDFRVNWPKVFAMAVNRQGVDGNVYASLLERKSN